MEKKKGMEGNLASEEKVSPGRETILCPKCGWYGDRVGNCPNCGIPLREETLIILHSPF